MLLCGGNCWGTEEIEFTNREALETEVSSNGTFTLKWSNPEKVEVSLEQSGDESFQPYVVRYVGLDNSSVLSGLAEGKHYFRVGPKGAETRSDVVGVEVKFFRRDHLLWLLGAGGIVVCLTIGTIIGGTMQHRKEDVR
ncbi:MAG: hypothetical protein P1U68_17425 [Verrucomicrobiales bacterium]|nr:hypothetical protein [Verrucomicrobiales bacterium]